jgi:mannose-6-phosphate isomerase-like protein (cupin superfamily)
MSAALREVVVVPGAGEGPPLDIVTGEGSARAVIWPEMGATLRSMHRISLGRDARTIEMQHPSDAVYYVISGGGAAADRTTGERQALVEGSMVHVDSGTRYELAAGGDGMELVGGPCPADASLYERAGD